MIYRRFGYLQARVLLDKQDKMRLLEQELDHFDENNQGCAVTTQPNDYTKHTIEARSALLSKIDGALSDYSMFLHCSDAYDELKCNSKDTVRGTTAHGLQQANR